MMSRRGHKVKQVSELAGITVRTLHHYDRIGLLVPSARTASGYRLYDDGDLLRLQQILICRELGMPLESIRRLLSDPEVDRRALLVEHRDQLLERGRKNAAMIRAVDTALAMLEGDQTMEPTDLFDGFDPSAHEAEATQRWGHTTAYEESSRRTKGYTPEDWKRIKDDDAELMRELAAKLASGVPADDPTVRELAERHRLHIDRWYYPCSPAMHSVLAAMYVVDPRFTAAFDRYGDGLAAYLAAAIRANGSRDRSES